MGPTISPKIETESIKFDAKLRCFSSAQSICCSNTISAEIANVAVSGERSFYAEERGNVRGMSLRLLNNLNTILPSLIGKSSRGNRVSNVWEQSKFCKLRYNYYYSNIHGVPTFVDGHNSYLGD